MSEGWDDFLDRYYHDKILDFVKMYPEARSFEISFSDIEKWSPGRAQELLDQPNAVLPKIREVIIEALQAPHLGAIYSLEKAHVRVKGLPGWVGIGGPIIEHIGKMISIRGLVRKASFIQVYTVKAAFKCQRCEHVQYLDQPEGKFVEPFTCENETCGRKGPFQEIISEATLIERQIIEVQEPPEDMSAGQQAQGMKVILDDDLAGLCRCGDRVEIVGILEAERRASNSGKSPSLDIYLKANSLSREVKEFENLEITKEDEEKIKELAEDPSIYDKLVKSIALGIYGYSEVKEGIALQLFGGVTRKVAGGFPLRGNIHILLVGDPGIAKSLLLGYVASLAPRGIYTVGSGSTKSGLTAPAVKDHEGRWVLEAGALVLADKGFIALDELEKLPEDQQVGLHECFEQQTVSVAKAGITTTMNARCSCLAAANPKYGRFDKYAGLAEQINLPPALLSRFDLIFLILDQPDPKKDAALAKHILNMREASPAEPPPISRDLLRRYIAYSQREVSPALSEEAKRKLEEFYVDLRKGGMDPKSPVPLTPRTLEALTRLSEASARIRLSKEASLEDAERAIRLMEYSMGQVMVDPETGELDADIISAGISTNQRDRVRALADIIKELQENSPQGVPRSEIIGQYAVGITDQIDKDLEKMVEQKAIYRVKADHYKVVS